MQEAQMAVTCFLHGTLRAQRPGQVPGHAIGLWHLQPSTSWLQQLNVA